MFVPIVIAISYIYIYIYISVCRVISYVSCDGTVSRLGGEAALATAGAVAGHHGRPGADGLVALEHNSSPLLAATVAQSGTEVTTSTSLEHTPWIRCAKSHHFTSSSEMLV